MDNSNDTAAAGAEAVEIVEVDMIEEFAVLEENERLLLASFEEGFELDSLTT